MRCKTNTIRFFCSDNFLKPNDYNLYWCSRDDSLTFKEYMQDMFYDYDTIRRLSYEYIQFITIRWNQVHNKPKLKDCIKVNKESIDYKLSNWINVDRIEYTLESAIETFNDLDEIDEDTYNKIGDNIESHEGIVEYMKWHYENIGPLYCINGKFIL